jgi:phosphatidylethanolamine-binding protein (PEBP) family uncharacterized protein
LIAPAATPDDPQDPATIITVPPTSPPLPIYRPGAPWPDPSATTTVPPTTAAPFGTLTVDFGNRNQIDDRFTCAGANVSPSLSWSVVPEGTVETVVWMEGARPMRGPARERIQWAVTGIDPTITSLPENTVPAGSTVVVPYGATCSSNATDAYHFTVYFLAAPVDPASFGDPYLLSSELRRLALDGFSASGYRNLDPMWWE